MHKQAPIIGILTNILTVETGVLSGTERIYVNRDYVTSVLKAGAIPFLLPIIPDLEATKRQIEQIDGLLLSGGQDVCPHLYNEEPSLFLEETSHERDLYELQALRYAYELKKPLFGVCRGLQLINVAFGGTLYQDIPQHYQSPQEPKEPLTHSQNVAKQEATHTVDLSANSWLSSIYENNTTHLHVNSFHHQAIKDLAPGFQVTARSKDGIIEAIEKIDECFIVAVQWHPEMMTEHHEEMHALFCAFVSRAALGGSHAH